MNSDLVNFQTIFNDGMIKFRDEYLNRIYQNFRLYFISKLEDIILINDIKNETKIIIFDIIECNNEECVTACFDKTIIIVLKTNISFLQNFFTDQKDSLIITISDEIPEILSKYTQINERESNEMREIYDNITTNEYSKFLSFFLVKYPAKEAICEIWIEIRRSILSFIVKKSYCKLNNDHNRNFKENEKEDNLEITLNNHNYIKIKHLGTGSSLVDLIYHIEHEQLLALKRCQEETFLIEREKRNYKMIDHPFITKYYGAGEIGKDNFLLVEYINGVSLNNIKELCLTKEDKIMMIFGLLDIIKYLHKNGFIYRDLKPSNFIIDESKTIVLTDFDRMLTNEDEQNTKNFNTVYIDPDVMKTKRYSYEVDIYSLGLIMYFIIMEKNPPNEPYYQNISDEFDDYFCEVGKLCEKCISIESSSRPSIEYIIHKFYKCYSSQILHSIFAPSKKYATENAFIDHFIQILMNDEQLFYQVIQDLSTKNFKEENRIPHAFFDNISSSKFDVNSKDYVEAL